jgi:hypothetical protein
MQEVTHPILRVNAKQNNWGAYRSQFFPEESMACRCGFPMETVSHILYRCLSHERELEPKEQLRYSWLLEFLEANKTVFAFDVP